VIGRIFTTEGTKEHGGEPLTILLCALCVLCGWLLVWRLGFSPRFRVSVVRFWFSIPAIDKEEASLSRSFDSRLLRSLTMTSGCAAIAPRGFNFSIPPPLPRPRLHSVAASETVSTCGCFCRLAQRLAHPRALPENSRPAAARSLFMRCCTASGTGPTLNLSVTERLQAGLAA
jgi:hypothetical protein